MKYLLVIYIYIDIFCAKINCNHIPNILIFYVIENIKCYDNLLFVVFTCQLEIDKVPLEFRGLGLLTWGSNFTTE